MGYNVKNLRTPTPEEARERGRKGGLASAAARKKKKQRRQLAAEILDHGITEEQKYQIEKMLGNLDEGDATVFTMMLAGMVRAAVGGNVKAFEVVCDMADSGEVKDEAEIDDLSKSLRELANEL